MGAKARLPFWIRTRWRWRWMQAPGKITMHRIKSYKLGGSHRACDRLDWGCRGVGKAETVCGLKGRFEMPGFNSRLSALRCGECCDKLSIRRGRGAPFNDGINA